MCKNLQFICTFHDPVLKMNLTVHKLLPQLDHAEHSKLRQKQKEVYKSHIK